MKHSKKPFLNVLNGVETPNVPFWFMRQAGRYLPEYKQLRSTAKDFLDFCYSPQKAAEATLQPITRFGMSAAIIFSDILVIPDALGVEVHFEEGKGPILKPIKDAGALAGLQPAGIQEKLEPVYEALRLTAKALPEETALIGFCGAPWTLACYMVHGSGSRDFQDVRQTARRDPAFFSQLLSLLTHCVILHAKKQIEAGAQAIQIFDSWAGTLSAEEFDTYVIAPAKAITAALKQSYPQVPLIGFPRLAGPRYVDYSLFAGFDALSVDFTVPTEWIQTNLQPHTIVQGNLDPLLLAEDKTAMLKQAEKILHDLRGKPFIFNLGHGILPHTPPEHVAALCELIRESRP